MRIIIIQLFIQIIFCLTGSAQTDAQIFSEGKVSLTIQKTDREGILTFTLQNNENFEICVSPFRMNRNYLVIVSPNGERLKRASKRRSKKICLAPGETKKWTHDLNLDITFMRGTVLGTYTITWELNYLVGKRHIPFRVTSKPITVVRSTKLFRENETPLDIRFSSDKDSVQLTLTNNSPETFRASDIGLIYNLIKVTDKDGNRIASFHTSQLGDNFYNVEPNQSKTWYISVTEIMDKLHVTSLDGYSIEWYISDVETYPKHGEQYIRSNRDLISKPIPFNQLKK